MPHKKKMLERQDQVNFQCPVCCRKLCKSEIEIHLSTHNIKSSYNNPICETQVADEIIPKSLVKEAQKHKCGMCLITLASRTSLRSHIRRHFTKISCNICEKTLKSKKELQIHLATQHRQGPYCCNICKTACFTKNSLESHMLTHRNNQIEVDHFKCNLCDKKFIKDCSLKNHLRQVHTKTLTKFICQICGQSLHSNRYLRVHMSLHTTPKSHKCEECGKLYSTKSTLTVHSRTHAGLRPYKCELCDKKFTQLSSLKVHLTVHTKEKPFLCKVCEKRFSSKGQMKIHMKTKHNSVD